jgi:hypothetical protein
MAIDFTSASGGLARFLGRIGGLLNSINAGLDDGDLSAASIVSLGVGADNIEAVVNGVSAKQSLTTGLYAYRDQARAAQAGLKAYLQQLAQAAVIRWANDDTPLPALTLVEALKEVKRQMVSGSESFTRPAVSATPTAGGSNVGDGRLIASVLDATGAQMDYLFAESLKYRCTSDGQGTGTAGSETFTLYAPVAQADPLAFDWPLGSGASGSLTAVSAGLNNSGGNVLQNSSFATFTTAHTPDNWPIDVGTAGTSILQATGSNAYTDSSGLAFVGDGAELTSVEQPFDTTPSTSAGSGGTSYTVKASTVYAVNLWVKVSSTPAAGVLEVALVDGSGNVTQDAAGTQNLITQSLPAVSTTWVPVNGFFRTPAANPSDGYRLRVRLSTALSNTHTVYIDHLAMAEATRVYSGGPYVALFSGDTDFLLEDLWTVAVANDYSSDWALLLERLFSLRSLGIALPSSGAPTIPDSYVA